LYFRIAGDLPCDPPLLSKSLEYYAASVRGAEEIAPASESSLSRRLLGPIVSQSITEALVEALKRECSVRLTHQHQQWVGVLLGASLGAFACVSRHEHDCTHEFVLFLFVRLEGRREKCAVGIAVFVP